MYGFIEGFKCCTSHRLLLPNASTTIWWSSSVANDTDMQTSNKKESFIAGVVHMHSSVIERGRVCGYGSAGGRLMEVVLGLC